MTEGWMLFDEEKVRRAINQIRQHLLDGTYFITRAALARRVRASQPPLGREQWSHLIETLAKMGKESDPLAQIAAVVISHVSLHSTDHEEEAAVYEAAAKALRYGYNDVAMRDTVTGRPHNRKFTLEERLLLAWWLNEATAPLQSRVPDVGWAVVHLTMEMKLHVPPELRVPWSCRSTRNSRHNVANREREEDASDG